MFNIIYLISINKTILNNVIHIKLKLQIRLHPFHFVLNRILKYKTFIIILKFFVCGFLKQPVVLFQIPYKTCLLQYRPQHNKHGSNIKKKYFDSNKQQLVSENKQEKEKNKEKTTAKVATMTEEEVQLLNDIIESRRLNCTESINDEELYNDGELNSFTLFKQNFFNTIIVREIIKHKNMTVVITFRTSVLI